jgi:hypothetical protein
MLLRILLSFCNQIFPFIAWIAADPMKDGETVPQ